MSKKILAILLSLSMIGSAVSMSVFADEIEAETAEVLEMVEAEETEDEIASEEEIVYDEADEFISKDIELSSMSNVSLMATSGLSGAGTASSPYLIYNESDLLELSSSTDKTFLSAYFRLENNITLTTSNWSPIGISTSTPFSGTFDGNGYKISNVEIPENSYSYAGLFGIVTGTITNLGVNGAIGNGSTAGVLAGMLQNGVIEYCYTDGSVSSTSGNTGGLVGYMNGTSRDIDCYIHDSYSTATITNTSTNGSTGGLVGHMYFYYGNNLIKDCYAAGKVTGSSSNVGGLVGGRSSDGSTSGYYNSILSSYHVSSVTKQTDTRKGFSITSNKARIQDTYTSWDFANTWKINNNINNGYPYIDISGTKIKVSISGNGTESNPYMVNSAEQLFAIARGEIGNNYTAYYKLQNDIEVNSDYWTPIGGNNRPAFSGTLDGNGHTISGIKITQDAFVNSGLFGYLTGTVKNLNVNINLSGVSRAGAIAGYIENGTISYTHSTGTISSISGDTGGLVGYMCGSSRDITCYIHDSYSTTTVTNTATNGSTGGLVGHMYFYYGNNLIKDCYAASKVTGSSSNVGGLVGQQSSDGSTSGYYNGIISCYHISSLTKQSDTRRGFSITSAKAKLQNTYTGWDFENVWEIDSSANNGYPYLNVRGEKEEIELEGSGTENDPYLVYTAEELIAMSRGELRNNYTAYYQLQNDIIVNSDYWTPIGGNYRPAFSGTFDGDGHTIRGIKITQDAFFNSGFFGYLTGTVKNLKVNINLSGVARAGAIAGCIENGNISYTQSTGAISSISGETGGLVGYMCGTSRDITCYIHDSYSTATVTNTATNGSTGGLVGHMYFYYGNNLIKDSYAAGKVTGSSSNVGGLVGQQSSDGSTNGYYNGIISCYHISDDTKQEDTRRGFSITSANAKLQETYTGWDFDNIWEINSSENNGYPYINVRGEKEEVELEGSGTETDPYLIYTAEELTAISRGELRTNYTAYYQLQNDIEVNSDYWTPIGGNGRPVFSGTFDGNGHTIRGIKLTQNAFPCTGLFGYLTGTVKNVNVDANFSGVARAGVIAGQVENGTIEYTYATGSVSSVSYTTGGLVGYMYGSNRDVSCTIHDSYSTATVTNTATDGHTGGLVGHMYFYYGTNIIQNCYATGKVTGSSSNVGGLVGGKSSDGSTNGYYNNVISSYYDNYNDTNTDKGTLTSTENMKKRTTYSDWDFNNIWSMSSSVNNGYPYLQSMIPKATISVTSVQLNKTTTSLSTGGTETLIATVSPSNATNKNVTWTSSSTSVVTVSNGKITAKGAGTATITVKTADGNYTATCSVTVTDNGSQPDNPNPPVTDGAVVKVSSVTASAGNTVNVTVDLSGNKGFANLGIQVGYDANNLTLTSVTNNASVGATYTGAQSITANPYNMGWDSTNNITYNGNLATLTFKVKENVAEGKYPITVSYYKGISGNYTDGEDVNYDADFNSLGLNYVNGAIIVSSHIAGDINGDGKVNNQDGTFLLRHLAGWNVNIDESALDVNGDGRVNNQDGTVLLRYLAGWSVTIH